MILLNWHIQLRSELSFLLVLSQLSSSSNLLVVMTRCMRKFFMMQSVLSVSVLISVKYGQMSLLIDIAYRYFGVVRLHF